MDGRFLKSQDELDDFRLCNRCLMDMSMSNQSC